MELNDVTTRSSTLLLLESNNLKSFKLKMKAVKIEILPSISEVPDLAGCLTKHWRPNKPRLSLHRKISKFVKKKLYYQRKQLEAIKSNPFQKVNFDVRDFLDFKESGLIVFIVSRKLGVVLRNNPVKHGRHRPYVKCVVDKKTRKNSTLFSSVNLSCIQDSRDRIFARVLRD